MSSLRFNPASPQAVLADIASPDLSLRQIAEKHGATLESLSLWLSRDDIQTQIHAVNELNALVTRSAAIALSRRAVAAISTAIDEAAALLDLTPRPSRDEIATERTAHGTPESSHSQPSPTRTRLTHPASPRAPHSALALLEFRRRLSDSIRLGGSMLLRMTRFAPGSAPRSRPEPSAQPQRPDTRAANSSPTAPATHDPAISSPRGLQADVAASPRCLPPTPAAASIPQPGPGGVTNIAAVPAPPQIISISPLIEHPPNDLAPSTRPRAPAASLLAAAGRAR